MSSKRVTLRQVCLEDAVDLALWKDQPLMRKMSTGLKTEISEENQRQDIEHSLESPGEEYWIICSQSPIGYIRINWMDDLKQSVWLRFGLGLERGCGYAREALDLFIKNLFNRSVIRIEAEVYDYNQRSYDLLKSLNFKEEGLKRQAHIEEGHRYDVYVMGLIESDITKKEA
jgi:RimJ/RimL family protein N-acetyltransferase